MARLTQREQKLAGQLYAALRDAGAGEDEIEALAGNTAALKELVDGTRKLAPAPGGQIPAGVIQTMFYHKLLQSGIGEFGILQCLTPDEITGFTSLIGKRGLAEISTYLGQHGARHRRSRDTPSNRVREVYGDPRRAPVVLAAVLSSLWRSEITRLRTEHSVETLGDLKHVSHESLHSIIKDAERVRKFRSFLRELGIK